MRAYLGIGALIFITSCMVGPNYVPPDPCIPECSQCDPTPPITAWWELFQDPLLNRYIEEVATCNPEVLAAEAVILQARAIRQITASQLLPQANLDLSASRTYFSKNGPLFAIDAIDTADTPGLPFDIQVPQLQNIFTVLLDVTWNIDLFGKIRREVEASNAMLGAAFAERDDLLLSLFAEVAKNYIDLRKAQNRGILVEEKIALLEKEASLSKERVKKGLSNRLTLELQEAELERTKGELPPICFEIAQSIYALSVLTGKLPEALLGELCPYQPLPSPPLEVTCGLRSDLIRRRPDMRYAERSLAAATANIGVAVASFFPSFNLGANIGLQSIQLSNLFEGNSITWSLGGASIIPLFQGGNLVGNLRLSEAAAMSAAFTYQKTLLQALKEVESELVAYHQEEARALHLKNRVKHFEAYNQATEERYRKGLISVTEWIESQVEVNQSKQELLESEATLLIDLITLYKALGGGWEYKYL